MIPQWVVARRVVQIHREARRNRSADLKLSIVQLHQRLLRYQALPRQVAEGRVHPLIAVAKIHYHLVAVMVARGWLIPGQVEVTPQTLAANLAFLEQAFRNQEALAAHAASRSGSSRGRR